MKYKNEVAKVHVIVSDTKKPKFNKINTFESIRDVDINWADYIKATDLSEVNIEIDDSNVNIYSTGEYVLTAIAIDSSGNERKKEIKVVIKERPENMYAHSIETNESNGHENDSSEEETTDEPVIDNTVPTESTPPVEETSPADEEQ